MPAQSTSGVERLTAIQNNVRSMLQEVGTPAPSSLYSASPNPQTARNEAPRPSPRRSLFGRIRGLSTAGNTPQTDQPTWQHPHHPFGQQIEYSPASEPSEWSRLPDEPEAAAHSMFRHPADTAPVMDEERDLEAAVPVTQHRSKRHKRKRRRQRREGVWTRRHGQRKSATCLPLLHGHTRVKTMTCLVSGLFLASILATYLSIALTVKGLGQELHVLFIITIIGTTIFFAHSVIRLCIMVLRPPRERRRGLIPSIAGPEGFTPDVPIQVQLARDEEIAAQTEDGVVDEEKLEAITQPPPAYGLWRCSVRINPNLLHWQRVEDGESPVDDGARSPPGSPRTASPTLEPIAEVRQGGQPRPPSYISDDGVSYVVSALPPRPPSEIHPAFRIRLP